MTDHNRDELIEKAAKAMADAGDMGWKGHTPDERDWYLRDARVALAVFREHDREVAAKAWDEGALWAAVEIGVIGSEGEAWLAPGDNPYRDGA